jgi:hypothetical protein
MADVEASFPVEGGRVRIPVSLRVSVRDGEGEGITVLLNGASVARRLTDLYSQSPSMTLRELKPDFLQRNGRRVGITPISGSNVTFQDIGSA